MNVTLWTLIGFLSGSLMFSLWIGQLAGKDIRQVGDGNPGVTNLFIAGGKALGMAALLPDVFKGALPVWLARTIGGIDGWALVPVALAPVLGHAFSPWLGGHGGKAVAVTFGIWIGLTIWEAPTFLGILLGLWFAFVAASGWAVMLAMACLLAYYLLVNPNTVYIAVWGGNAALLAWKYRADLRRLPEPRGWLKARLGWQ